MRERCEQEAREICNECPDGMWEDMEKWLVEKITTALLKREKEIEELKKERKDWVDACYFDYDEFKKMTKTIADLQEKLKAVEAEKEKLIGVYMAIKYEGRSPNDFDIAKDHIATAEWEKLEALTSQLLVCREALEKVRRKTTVYQSDGHTCQQKIDNDACHQIVKDALQKISEVK